jgi:alkanesulfonate monooxygenase SsuD/methylene tetrahydromethanopterin reductase-like flavin-dependent oxidoreductase (luciferase family)
VAASTDRVAVGTAALTALTRHPAIAAHAVATLDRVAEGRLILGLGAGFPYPDTTAELRTVGVPVTGRLDRLAATVRQWRALWGVDGFPAPTAPAGPPLWFAGAGPKGLELAGELFDGWLPYLSDVDAYLAARRGLPQRDDFVAALYVTVLVDDDAERAEKQLNAYTQAYYGAPLALMSTLQAFVHGSADACAARLQEYAVAGASHVVVRIGSLTPEDLLEETAAALLGRVSAGRR